MQIQVRDPDGRPIPRINLRIIEGTKAEPVLDDAEFDYDTDASGNKGWPIKYWPTNQPYTLHVNAADINPTFETIRWDIPAGCQEDIVITLPRVSAPVRVVVTRIGTPQADGRGFRDEAGRFYPLGQTLFWALDGWRNDRERLKQQWAWLGPKHGFDYQRILADVGWPTQPIDSSASDFEDVLAAVIDCAYDDFGLRTEVTVWGGSDPQKPRDPLRAARRVAGVVRGRQHKVMHLEAGNESFQNGPPDATLDEMVRILRDAHPLVAASSPQTDFPTWLRARTVNGASLSTAHFDRSTGDEDWRFVRQVWDARDWGFLMSNNEGKGPRSSVSETTSIPRLVLHRALGLLCGVSAFVLHNAVGVTGRVDPAHNRPANLWEVPGIDELMVALRRLDAWLPDDIHTWEKTTQHGGDTSIGPHPLRADAIWSDGADHGVSRCYAGVRGDRFVSLVLGVKKWTDLLARASCELEVINVGTTERTPVHVNAGERYRLVTGQDNADAGFLIRGRLV